MSILSLEFLAFISIIIAAYYIMPLKIRWGVLLAASAVFIALSGWQSALHLSIIALVMWGGGLLLNRLKGEKNRKIALGLLLGLDIGAMILIKYQPAIANWLNGLIQDSKSPVFSVWGLAAPLGLSYFTFQSAGYLIDVYYKKAEPQRNPLKAWLFIGYFPQLTQGPISRWHQLSNQLFTGHQFNPEGFISGFLLMLWGYFKKMVIADRLMASTNILLTEGGFPGWFVIGGVILYTIRLYMDFSGGMDAIRGISRMLGIELPENFRRPFFSQSISEYWRRWHITLGEWFRSYLLYPLITSRMSLALSKYASNLFGKKTGRAIPSALATIIIFVLIGMWHSANWNAVIYGGYFGLIMAASMLLEPLWKGMRRKLKLPKAKWMTPLRMVRTFICILPAQYFAFTLSPAQGAALMAQSFQNWGLMGFSEQVNAVMPPIEWLIAILGMAIALTVDILCERGISVCDKLAKARTWVRWPVMLLLIFIIIIFGMYGPGYDGRAFLYTQF